MYKKMYKKWRVWLKNEIRNLLRYGIKAKPCMESSRSDVWNQSAGKCTLKRDAMRDFVAITYNAQVR